MGTRRVVTGGGTGTDSTPGTWTTGPDSEDDGDDNGV
jgi:hypothetical protein